MSFSVVSFSVDFVSFIVELCHLVAVLCRLVSIVSFSVTARSLVTNSERTCLLSLLCCANVYVYAYLIQDYLQSFTSSCTCYMY